MEDAPGDGAARSRGRSSIGNGNRVGDEFRSTRTRRTYQHSPSIVALSGGRFIVTWTDNSGIGTDNQDDAIRAQIFSVSGATLRAPVTINIAANLTDTDGSETLALSVSGIPVGANLSDGVHSFTATAGNTSVDVTGWSIHGLSVVPAQGFVGDVTITVNATTTDHATLAPGVVTDTKTVSQTITLTIISGLATLTSRPGHHRAAQAMMCCSAARATMC